jgi:hypothetical protein
MGEEGDEGGQFVELPIDVGDEGEIRILFPNGVSVMIRQPLSAGLLKCLAHV